MFIAPDGSYDFGLFCREHAYHTFLLCHLYGIPAQIAIGHYFIKANKNITNCSLGSGADHAWCVSKNVFPIDMSMTFHLAPDYPNLDRPLIGVNKNGDYIIKYFTTEEEFKENIDNNPDNSCIYFYEQSILNEPIIKLLNNPFCFMLPPSIPGQSWADVHGKNIFAKITFHLYKLSKGLEKPLYKRFDSLSAVRHIKSKYMGAMPKLKSLLKQKSPTKQ